MTTDNDQWRPCQSGELVGLAQRLNRRRHRRQFLLAFSALTIGAVGMVGGALIWSKPQEMEEYRFAGIGCSEVHELVMRGRFDQLSPEIRRQLRHHVQECPHCGPRLRERGITPEMLSMRAHVVAVAQL
jgi:hypothetical protein